MDKDELAKRLAEAIRNFTEILESLETPPASTEAEAKRRFEAGLCTFCGKALTAKHDRGAHHRCYKSVMRMIEQGKMSKDDVVSLGWLLPAKTGGRPPKPGSPAHRLMEIELKKRKP